MKKTHFVPTLIHQIWKLKCLMYKIGFLGLSFFHAKPDKDQPAHREELVDEERAEVLVVHRVGEHSDQLLHLSCVQG